MIKVLKKAVDILSVIASGDGISYTEILEATGMNKATLSNLLKSLRELGLVDRDSRSLFRIGTEAVNLTRNAISRETLAGAGYESVQRFLRKTGENISAASFKWTERFILAKADAEASMTVNDSYTSNTGFYNTATGRVLFAFMTDEQRREITDVHGLPGDAWNGMTSKTKLARECAAIRKKGYVSFEVNDGLMQYIGVPVLDRKGNIRASLGSGIPAVRYTEAFEKKILSDLQQEARRMEETLELRGITR